MVKSNVIGVVGKAMLFWLNEKTNILDGVEELWFKRVLLFWCSWESNPRGNDIVRASWHTSTHRCLRESGLSL